MKRLSTIVASLVLLFPIADGFAQPQTASSEKVISIGTGSVSGVYYPSGGAICRLMNRTRKDTGMRCFAESTGGSRNNINELRSGDISFAITQADWQYNAWRGEGAFIGSPAFTDMRSVFSLYTEMFTVAVGKNSGITSFDGLKGKRVNVGEPGSGTKEMIQALLDVNRAKNIRFGDTTELKPSDAAQALCDGKIDAMVMAMGHPNGLIQNITSNCGAKLIPIQGKEVNRMLTDNPYYACTTIPGSMYRGNPDNIDTFGVKASLITTAAMDDETVYRMTKSVFENFESFQTLHFVFATLDKERMATTGLVAPLHPGALRYYREVGLIKDEPASVVKAPAATAGK